MHSIKLLFALLIAIPSASFANQCDLSLVDYDAKALDVLSAVVLSKKGHTRLAAEWLSVLERHGENEPRLTVNEHTALSYIIRTGYFADLGQHDLEIDATRLLRQSWLELTGTVPADIYKRLPYSVRARATREQRAYHAASFQTRSVPLAQKELAFGQDYVAMPADIVGLSFVMAALFTDTGAQEIGAAFLGYALSSTIEHVLHRFSGHAPPRLQNILRKMGWFGRSVLRTEISHNRVHHALATKDYEIAFGSTTDRTKLEERMKELGEWFVNLKKSEYGLSLSSKGIATGMAISSPIFALTAWILGMDFIETIAFATPSAFYVLASAYFHPYLHKRRSRALELASPPMRWFLKTRFAEARSREHYGHHRGRGGNFNLVPGADWFFGQHRKPNLHQLFKMRELQLIGAVFEPE